jgi:hypothetical protein
MNYSCFEGLVGSFKALQGKKTVSCYLSLVLCDYFPRSVCVCDSS